MYRTVGTVVSVVVWAWPYSIMFYVEYHLVCVMYNHKLLVSGDPLKCAELTPFYVTQQDF